MPVAIPTRQKCVARCTLWHLLYNRGVHLCVPDERVQESNPHVVIFGRRAILVGALASYDVTEHAVVDVELACSPKTGPKIMRLFRLESVAGGVDAHTRRSGAHIAGILTEGEAGVAEARHESADVRSPAEQGRQ